MIAYLDGGVASLITQTVVVTAIFSGDGLAIEVNENILILSGAGADLSLAGDNYVIFVGQIIIAGFAGQMGLIGPGAPQLQSAIAAFHVLAVGAAADAAISADVELLILTKAHFQIFIGLQPAILDCCKIIGGVILGGACGKVVLSRI